MLFWSTLIIFCVVLVLQYIYYRGMRPGFFVPLHAYMRVLFWVSVAGVLAYYLYLTFAQYVAWRDAGPPTVFLVPPYRSIAYVFGYHATRFLMYYAVSFLAATFLLWFSLHGNRRFGERFFEREEPYIGALAIFLLGSVVWNFAWIFYLFLLFGVYLVLHIFHVFRRSRSRVPMYWLWMPVGIVVLVGGQFLF